jgi:uncharacterized protein DUF6876
MDFMEQNALRAELRQFTGSTEFFRHFTNAIIYTEGVKFLAEHARLYWLIDLIASLQPRALKDRMLREFQLWELRIANGKTVLVCLRDSDDEAFRVPLKLADSALDYVRLYLEGGTLMLPSEH